MDWDAEDIRKIHVDENGWSAIGYHYIIKRDGSVDRGRPHNAVGAHTRGYNSHSIGLCLIGGMAPDGSPAFNFTKEQMISLNVKVAELKKEYPEATIHGHNEFADKACPCFSIKDYFS
jgi:N-acetylmuramoyl-L-alanine amidase